jgi:hypothetical protein
MIKDKRKNRTICLKYAKISLDKPAKLLYKLKKY